MEVPVVMNRGQVKKFKQVDQAQREGLRQSEREKTNFKEDGMFIYEM